MEQTKTTFNPNDHLTQIKGKSYLEVKWRLVWFREEKPEWAIETEVADRGDGWALMKALIKDEKGRVLVTGHKSETKSDFGDYLEKAETGAIGRALALLGYGTQFATELEEGERVVDAPIEKKTPQKASEESTGATKEYIQDGIEKLLEDKSDVRLATEGQVRAVWAISNKKGMSGEEVKALYRVTSLKELTFDQASGFIKQYGDKVEGA